MSSSGLILIPIPRGRKGPVLKNWQTLAFLHLDGGSTGGGCQGVALDFDKIPPAVTDPGGEK